MGQPDRPKGEWQLQTAKARFSELFARTRSEGPQRVTRHGREAVIVVSEEDWNRRVSIHGGAETSRSLVDFLMRSPLRGGKLVIDRTSRC